MPVPFLPVGMRRKKRRKKRRPFASGSKGCESCGKGWFFSSSLRFFRRRLPPGRLALTPRSGFANEVPPFCRPSFWVVLTPPFSLPQGWIRISFRSSRSPYLFAIVRPPLLASTQPRPYGALRDIETSKGCFVTILNAQKFENSGIN